MYDTPVEPDTGCVCLHEVYTIGRLLSLALASTRVKRVIQRRRPICILRISQKNGIPCLCGAKQRYVIQKTRTNRTPGAPRIVSLSLNLFLA